MYRIAIIGSGVVGQATGKGFNKIGHSITFLDIDMTTLAHLNQEGYETAHVSQLNSIKCESTIICLPTPFNGEKVDLTSFEETLPLIGKKISSCDDYHIVVIRSTIPPGTIESLIIPRLEQYSKKMVGRDFGVCMNPEFLRQKTSEMDFLKPWSIVIGALDKRSADALLEIYRYFIENEKPKVAVTDLRTAEMIKYAQNMYNATKISFTNEIWKVCQSLEIDGDSVMTAVAQSAEGMWNPLYGTKGGYPYSGHCLPKDTRGFLTYAKEELKIEMPLLEAVIAVNDSVEVVNMTGEKLS